MSESIVGEELRRDAPELWRGVPCWKLEQGAFHARFLGLGAPARAPELAGWLEPRLEAVSWLHQCHGEVVLEAEPGLTGDGDALVLRRPGIAAVVATADCVPVIVLGEEAGAAIHAGWRGVAAGVVGRALDRLGETARAAWIGPAIGPCCYEVGADVATAVVAASDPRVAVPGRGERPHLDLRRAVAVQLAARGVGAITIVDVCTRCHPELLSSHRRDGARAGRNLSALWRAA
jgi:YfiH family protein